MDGEREGERRLGREVRGLGFRMGGGFQGFKGEACVGV